MSGISSSIGLISGIDTGSLINQLLALEARPRQLVQQRIVQLQTRQTAFLDLNNLLGGLRSAARSFNTDRVFFSAQAQSSDPDVLTASANSRAPIGQYTFLVDRLTSSQQLLSRGFADRDISAVGIEELTFEREASRLDRDTELSELNGGNGVRRGELRITDRGGATVAVDLSRAATVNEVLDAINASGAQVEAVIDDDRIVLRDTSGLSTGAIAVGTSNVATDLGLVGGTFAGGEYEGGGIYALTDTTSIRSLNDGLGLRFFRGTGTIGPDGASSPDFEVTARDGQVFKIDLGEVREFVDILDDNGDPVLDGQGNPTRELQITAGAVSTVGQLRQRVEEQTEGDLTVEIVGRSLRLVDNTGGGGNLIVEDISGTAEDLGFVTDPAGVASNQVDGQTLLAGINSRLTRLLGGGTGLAGDGKIAFTLRDGTSFSVADITTLDSFSQIIDEIETASGGLLDVSLDETGNKLVVRDLTGGSGNLVIAGTNGENTAEALGIEVDIAADSTTGSRLQRQWVGEATLLRDLDERLDGAGGKLAITNSTGVESTITITSETRTVGDLLDLINRGTDGLIARVNDNGDGIVIEQDPDPDAPQGSQAITISDREGNIAKRLNLAGTSTSTDPESNRVDGSFERVVEFNAAEDTLDDIVQKINDAGVGMRASVVSDGSAGNRYRINFRADRAGSDGRFTVDAGAFNLGLSVLNRGEDARVFFGSTDPATAVLVTTSADTLDDVVPGVSIDLNRADEEPVTVTVGRDTDKMLESVNTFVESFNRLVGRIDTLSDYNETTQKKGTLLGDSTTQQLRRALFTTIQSEPLNVAGGYRRLSDVGIKIVSGGKLEVDTEKLRAAIEDDPQAVADLFGAREQAASEPQELSPGVFAQASGDPTFTSLGVAELVAQLADRYTDSVNGILTRQTQTIDTQINSQRDRVSFFDAKLEDRRAQLEAQFAAMEQTLAQLQRQQGALGSITSFGG